MTLVICMQIFMHTGPVRYEQQARKRQFYRKKQVIPVRIHRVNRQPRAQAHMRQTDKRTDSKERSTERKRESK